MKPLGKKGTTKTLSRNAIRDSEETFIAKLLASKIRIAAATGDPSSRDALELSVRHGRKRSLEARVKQWTPEMGNPDSMLQWLEYYTEGKGLELGGGW